MVDHYRKENALQSSTIERKMKDDLLRYGVIDCMSFVCLFLLSLYFFLLFDLKIYLTF